MDNKKSRALSIMPGFSMAEGEGFEPSVRITVRRLSRAVHSTTLPPFRGVVS